VLVNALGSPMLFSTSGLWGYAGYAMEKGEKEDAFAKALPTHA